jgi:LPXTG-motif cell wall-anchored protein
MKSDILIYILLVVAVLLAFIPKIIYVSLPWLFWIAAVALIGIAIWINVRKKK